MAKEPLNSRGNSELEARIRQLESGRWWTFLSVSVPVFVAVIGLVGAVWTASVEQTNRLRLTLLQEEKRLQTELVLRAAASNDREGVARSLLAFVEMGLLDDPEGRIREAALAAEVPLVSRPFESQSVVGRAFSLEELQELIEAEAEGVVFWSSDVADLLTRDRFNLDTPHTQAFLDELRQEVHRVLSQEIPPEPQEEYDGG
jgi:hypothetical protein